MVGSKQPVFSDTDSLPNLLLLRYCKTVSISLITTNFKEIQFKNQKEKNIRNSEIRKFAGFGFLVEVTFL